MSTWRVGIPTRGPGLGHRLHSACVPLTLHHLSHSAVWTVPFLDLTENEVSPSKQTGLHNDQSQIKTLVRPLAGVGHGGEKVPYAEGPAKINPSDA